MTPFATRRDRETELPTTAQDADKDQVEAVQLGVRDEPERGPKELLSLSEVNGSVRVPGPDATWYAKAASFAGVGFMVSVGYMDPGNWATDIAGGASYGYTLLSVILLSSIFAMFLQYMSLKLGAVTEKDLAQSCRENYSPWVNYPLWIIAEAAIAATDLAEVIGSAIALNLLFGIPLWAGVLITATDVLFILLLGTRNFRVLELFIFCLVATIAICFAYELAAVKPDWVKVLNGFVPKPSIMTDGGQLYNAIGILGATVMPHNLYLHSSIIQTRAYPRDDQGKRMAVKFGTYDSNVSLSTSFFVNASILILAAAAFHYGNDAMYREVADIDEAYRLLSPVVGTKAAQILFGVALLASGQNATITGTLSGQIVMEGFLQVRLKPWLRRLITRFIAIVPACGVAILGGSRSTGKLLVLSQVILSMALTFTVVPLVHFTCKRKIMGQYVNGWFLSCVGVFLALVIGGLNTYLVMESIRTNSFGDA